MNPEEAGRRKPLSRSESSDRFPARFEMYRQDGRRCLGTVFAKGKHTEARQNQFALLDFFGNCRRSLLFVSPQKNTRSIDKQQRLE